MGAWASLATPCSAGGVAVACGTGGLAVGLAEGLIRTAQGRESPSGPSGHGLLRLRLRRPVAARPFCPEGAGSVNDFSCGSPACSRPCRRPLAPWGASITKIYAQGYDEECQRRNAALPATR